MKNYKLGDMELEFANLIWENEPISSAFWSMIFCISAISCFESFLRWVNATKNCGREPLNVSSTKPSLCFVNHSCFERTETTLPELF